MIAYEVISNKNCNLKCYFCFTQSNQHQSCEILKKEDFEMGLDISVNQCMRRKDKNLLVKIYGGEPLLYLRKVEEYLRIIEKISKLHREITFLVTIITNGTNIDESFLKAIKEIDGICNVHLTVAFSLESDKETHDKIRVYKESDVSSYGKVIKNIEFYKKETGKFPKIQTALSPEMLGDIQGYINFIESNKELGTFEINPFFDDTNIEINTKHLQSIKVLFDYYIYKFKSNDYKHIGLYQQIRTQINRYSKDSQGHCKAGNGKLNILPNGDLTPCFRFHLSEVENNVYGNVNDTNVESKIISSENYYRLLKPAYKTICLKCQEGNDIGCLGKCLAVSLSGKNLNVGAGNSMCNYHIAFGKECNRLFEEIKTTAGAKEKLLSYSKGRNLPKEFEQLISNINVEELK